MTARRARSTLVVVAFLICLASVLFGQDSRARIVRLSYIDGNARIDQGSSKGEQRAILNMPVVQGTRVMAEDGARVEIEFENGSTLRLIGPSEVFFRELSMRGSGDKVSLVEVRNGLVYFDIAQKGDDEFRVALGNQNLAVRKSSHFRADATSGNLQVSVFKGELELLGAASQVAIKKHETVSFDNADTARYNLAKGVDPLGPDNWDRDRAQDRELYARSEEYKNSLSYAGSPYSYGMWDMASYGSWFAGPGGPCWRPMGYDMSWDPFSYGAWTYYPSNGWVFVSGYPWGWTPYRYGAWNYYGSTGWCWNPGGYYNGWNPMPVYYMVPTTYQAPTPPTKPGGPPVYIGGRKILPGGGQDPGAYRRPARGFDGEGPVAPGRGTTATNQQRNAGMPTAKPLTPVPSGRPWGMGAGTRNPGGMSNSRQSGPTYTPRGETQRQNTPRSEPMPRMEPAPRMSPPPMPAPAPAPRMPSAPRHD